MDSVNEIVKKTYTQQVKIEIKHGCSEFYESYPAFKKINFKGNQDMEYQSEWKNKENIIDKGIPIREDKDKKILGITIKGVNLSDILIIKNWLVFAKIINDESYKLIYDDEIGTNFIENILKPQLDFRKNELKFN